MARESPLPASLQLSSEETLLEALAKHQQRPPLVVLDEDTHFALSLAPMLKRLGEEEKHFAKFAILNALRHARNAKGLQETFPSAWPPGPAQMVRPYMPGQQQPPVQPYYGRHQQTPHSDGQPQTPTMPVNQLRQMLVTPNPQQQVPTNITKKKRGRPYRINSTYQITQSNSQSPMQTFPEQLLLPVQSIGQPTITQHPSQTPSPPVAFESSQQNVRIKVERKSPSPEVVRYTCDDGSTTATPTIILDASKYDFPEL